MTCPSAPGNRPPKPHYEPLAAGEPNAAVAGRYPGVDAYANCNGRLTPIQECFASEPRDAIRVVGKRIGKNLDRDVAIELRIASAVDLAHAAGAEQRVDFVTNRYSCRAVASRSIRSGL